MSKRGFPVLTGPVGLSVSAAAMLAACSGTATSPSSSGSSPVTVTRGLFTEADYGVSSSERVVDHRGPTRKGGGHYKLGKPYKVAGRWYVPREEPNYDRRGVASWYGHDFHGRKTSNGEVFDMHGLTAAHPTLPLPSYAYVTNVDNGRTILVRVNDRGPYVAGRIIDLSQTSARALGYEKSGKANVRVRYAGRAPLNGDDSRERQYLASTNGLGPGPRRSVAAVAQPRSTLVAAPQRFPQGSAGRWSPTTYRSALNGK